MKKAIFGDKGYVNNIKKKEYRSKGLFFGILDKSIKNHPLLSSKKKKEIKSYLV